MRGTVVGFVLGLIPGGGAIISPFLSYALEKRLSHQPEKFGTGCVEGVAGPETANNASAQAAFIPLLSLGIPSNVVTAVLVGALMIHGVEPGPLLISNHPAMFWGVITSMYLGNVMLLILNMPLIGLWVQILRVPYKILFPLILLFCIIGVYSVNRNVTEIWFMAFFGIVGYFMNKFKYEPAPFVMGLVLSPLMEDSFRQSLVLSGGSPIIFFSRPLSATLMSISLLVLISYCTPLLRRKLRRIEPTNADSI
jgi:putative tricarboxylic transport membrane protein